MFNQNREELKELVELCRPVMNFLEKKNEEANECYSIVINDNGVELNKTELYGIGGFSFRKTAQEVPAQEQLENLVIKADPKKVAQSVSSYSTNHDKD